MLEKPMQNAILFASNLEMDKVELRCPQPYVLSHAISQGFLKSACLFSFKRQADFKKHSDRPI